jgi:hypothetical protein
MNINLPYHLIIPAVISILIVAILIWKANKPFNSNKNKWLWISTIVFFLMYILIVGSAIYVDLVAQWDLMKFDLNGDGNFSGIEITPDQKEALKIYSADTGRNFSIVTGLIFSGLVTLLVFIIGKTIEYFKFRN